jgi:hypothetical protein
MTNYLLDEFGNRLVDEFGNPLTTDEAALPVFPFGLLLRLRIHAMWLLFVLIPL